MTGYLSGRGGEGVIVRDGGIPGGVGAFHALVIGGGGGQAG